MFYLQMNALLHTIKTIVLPSFSRHKFKLLSECCVFKVRQYKYFMVVEIFLAPDGDVLVLCRAGHAVLRLSVKAKRGNHCKYILQGYA